MLVSVINPYGALLNVFTEEEGDRSHAPSEDEEGGL